MLAAVGNHVAELHRSRIGNYTMPMNLKEGEWCWLSVSDLEQLSKSIE
jgi:16S rRNA pseudouridine516 synthase